MGRRITATLIALVAAASAAAQSPVPPREPIGNESVETAASKTAETAVGGRAASEEAADDDAAAARIRALIRDLDADTFRVRDDATKALAKAGPPALKLLRPALESTHSPEVRMRLAKIIEEIEIWGGQAGELKLDELIDRIPEIAQADWRAPGYRDQPLETLLTRWLRVLGQAAEKEDLKLPVSFGDVKAGKAETFLRNKLVVLGEGHERIAMADNSMVFSTAAVNLSHARNCVIVAKLGVNLAFCQNSVVIAGVDITAASAQNSVLVSGSQISASHPRGSIVAAGDRVDCSFADATTFVNSVPERDALNRGFRSVRVSRLILTDPHRKNDLADKLTITFISQSDNGLVLFRLADGSGEYVARKGKPITLPAGRPVEALSGWQLQYVARSLAVFAKDNGGETSVLRMGD